MTNLVSVRDLRVSFRLGKHRIAEAVRVEVGVVVERRPGVTPWAEFAWQPREVLEDFLEIKRKKDPFWGR